MKSPKTFTTAAIAGALTLASQTSALDAKAEEMEKCYGIVKAGKNDCANARGTHSCAGQAPKDGLWDEWVLLPEGTCDKIVGGSTQAKKDT